MLGFVEVSKDGGSEVDLSGFISLLNVIFQENKLRRDKYTNCARTMIKGTYKTLSLVMLLVLRIQLPVVRDVLEQGVLPVLHKPLDCCQTCS